MKKKKLNTIFNALREYIFDLNKRIIKLEDANFHLPKNASVTFTPFNESELTDKIKTLEEKIYYLEKQNCSYLDIITTLKQTE